MMFAAVMLVRLLGAVQDDYTWTEWDGWKNFGPDSYVVIEVESSVGKGVKSSVKSTLSKKEETQITLKTEVDVGGKTYPASDKTVQKDQDANKCKKCNKSQSSHSKLKKSGSEKVTVDGNDVDCTVVDMTIFDCDGNETGKGKVWITEVIPGGVAKAEIEQNKMTTKLSASKFEKK